MNLLYLHFELELSPDKIKDVNEKLRLEDGIIRYLLIKPKKYKTDPGSENGGQAGTVGMTK